ncbi:hypothetical protein GLOTRDRAFT_101862 [Gloeophyllum trabeum ATCC 11539]|uniref:Uncharacterized protein n=1 Tax=Gloeophyllum trabeum (strain ATCC 11539 / FP-39264 / Madison 617) TaxID=670483 RepID=S7R5T0_GLOTA|nr:uncharacterized protein GLOTRDRAFT_101862 [Gloeophyllum trabeum ATCC 11539]EPQ49740.1 hypothetical protein GLOTRDRAFT_101862 [Gloeophyllum trabeum ATCC 11539]
MAFFSHLAFPPLLRLLHHVRVVAHAVALCCVHAVTVRCSFLSLSPSLSAARRRFMPRMLVPPSLTSNWTSKSSTKTFHLAPLPRHRSTPGTRTTLAAHLG